ncbi:MAG TPA: DUF748 domain-containing protein [Candidatus Desulfobacillus sp.]|nr:DUF748 domain-containing protein [Candidatus Desulfobacillus sp.]
MSQPGAGFLSRLFARRGLRWTLGILLGLVILFGLLGYFWLPDYAKGRLETELSALLHRPVSIESIAVRPYSLEATVSGLRIGERPNLAGMAADAPPLLALGEARARLSMASLRRLAPVVSEVFIRSPRLHVERLGDGRYSVSDLVDEWLNKPDDGGKAEFSVSNISLEDGRVEFVDRPKDSRQVVSEIRLGIPFIANFPSEQETWVVPHFSAQVNGAPLTLEGKTRPFADRREALLELKLQDFDLTNVEAYAPVQLAARILSARLDTDLELVFGQTEGQPPDAALSGTVALRQVELAEAGGEAKTAHRLLKLPALELALARADTTGAVAIDRIAVDSPEIAVRRDAQGRLDWLSLIKMEPAAQPAAEKAATAPAAPSVPSASLRLSIAELAVNKGRLQFKDKAAATPLDIAPFELTAKGIDLAGTTPVDIAFDGTVNKRGKLRAEGSVAWAPLAADLRLDVRDVDLVPLQGWVADRLNAVLTRGTASFQGEARVAGETPAITVRGAGRLASFNVLDKVNAADLLRWRSLDVGGIDLATEPLKVDVASVALSDFFARIILSPEGRLNLKDIVRSDAAAEETAATPAPAAAAGPAAAAAPPAEKAQALPLSIGRITLQGGNVNFTDNFIKPNYRANLTELAGRIGPLKPGAPGDVEIRGSIDRTAPLEILGKADPFGSELSLDLAARAKGIDLPGFSPYSGKYLGYGIEKGKLSVDVKYRIEKGELKAENSIFLDQLTFGEKVDSPDALSIPLKLAVALLKNSRGEIDINLPISGTLNDPQFSIGGIIFKAFVNLIVKAVTAPFALLGSLFGGGEELSMVDFAPGRAALAPEAEKRLQALAKALADRPALKLEVTGRADPASDREGLKRAILERRVRAQKLAETAKKGEAGGSLAEARVTDEEYPKYLERAYKEEKFPKPKNLIGFTKSLPVPEMEQLMLANIAAGDDEMRQLATRRAEAVKSWLVERGGIDAARIFVLASKIESEADGKKLGSRAEFFLR